MNKIKFTPELEKATGEIEYNMTNDYMFRALFQKNNNALKGLLSSLLHMLPEEILSVEITNPIIIGEAIQDKEFRLDIKAVLNNYQQINLEMQVVNRYDCPEHCQKWTIVRIRGQYFAVAYQLIGLSLNSVWFR